MLTAEEIQDRRSIPVWRKLVLICGTRTFSNWRLLDEKMDHLTSKWWDVIAVLGGQRKWDDSKKRYVGADWYGQQWAMKRFYSVRIFAADWDKYGKSAGMRRNRTMAEYIGRKGGYCVAFWDGSSPGTAGMIRICKEYEIPTRVIRYKE
jgi:hypothetical protein